ncbi:MAG: ArsR/SmtB family transcription factor [Alphaproteobacteria bacterium]
MTNVSDMIEKSEEVANRLKLIANANRLRIACRVLKGEVSVGDIEKELDIRQPTLSREIAKLREGGVITARRQSKVVFYSLTNPDMRRLIEAVCLASSNTSDAPPNTYAPLPHNESMLTNFNPRPKFTGTPISMS